MAPKSYCIGSAYLAEGYCITSARWLRGRIRNKLVRRRLVFSGGKDQLWREGRIIDIYWLKVAKNEPKIALNPIWD